MLLLCPAYNLKEEEEFKDFIVEKLKNNMTIQDDNNV